MERYEMMNKAIMPVDQLVGAGFDALKKLGLYEPLKAQVIDRMRSMMAANFKAQNHLEILGEENVPETGGCIIASNHQSWMDAQVLGTGPKRRFHFIAKADFKEWPMLRRMLELTDSIYVRRGGDQNALDEITRAVSDGKAVVIFPEGTIPGEEDIPRWEVEKDTGLLRGHSGVVRIAMATGAPIIPVGLSGTGKAYPPEAYPRLEQMPPMPKPEPVTIRFGAPIYFKKPARELTRDELAERTKEVMKAISSLVDHSRNFVPISLPIQEKTEPSSLPRMAYSRSPKASDKDKATGKAPLGVLVLHGFTSDIHCVDELVKPLDAEGLPYRFPILRGHGTRFEDMEGVSDRDWYEDAENALLDLYRECEKVVVVGLSMGGLVTLELAARHRDKVAGVVTVAAALRFMDPMAGLTPVLAKFVKFWPAPNSYNDLELKKKENRNYAKFSTKAFGYLLDLAHNTTNLLSFVKAPILVMQSRKDQIVNPKAAKIIFEKVSSKDKDLLWFEKSGHEMLLDLEKDAALEAVMNFIRKIRTA